MDTRKKEFPHFVLLGALSLFGAVWPSLIQRQHVVVFQKFLTIQTSKIDPPRVAFDEVNLQESASSQKDEWEMIRNRTGSQLGVMDENRSFASASPVQALRSRKIVLQAMVFRGPEVEKVQEDRSWIDQLPVAAQKRMIESQSRYGVLDEEWKVPTFRELAAEKISEIKRQLLEEEKEKRPAVIVQAVSESGEVLTSVSKSDVQVQTDSEPRDQGRMLSGMIELKGLPPPTDSRWQIQLSRYDDDVKKEDATVDLKKSTYSIRIPEMSGMLVAQLRDTMTGEKLGEGTLRLSANGLSSLPGGHKITIEKSADHMAANFGSYYNNPTTIRSPGGREKPIATNVLFASLDAEGKTDETGLYRFDQVQKGSWGLLRAKAKGFSEGLHLVQSGKEIHLPLFPTNMMKALRQIVQDQSLTSEVPENGSIVWGQVLQNGRSFAGAEVHAEGFPNYQAIYFNSLLLPDPSLKATSENGYFAFIDLPEGFQTLTAAHGPIYMSHANVVVDKNAVSVAELDSLIQTEKSGLKVFDAFTGQPQAARLDLQSLPDGLDVQGYAEINLPNISRLSLMRVNPVDNAYSDSLHLYEDSMDSIHAPLIRLDWIQSLAASQKINLIPKTGVVIGFVPGSQFEVYVGHDPQFPVDQIVYFDPQGQIVPKGVPGGGFAIFNLPAGVQSIVVANTQTDMLQTQVIPMDDSALVTLKFR